MEKYYNLLIVLNNQSYAENNTELVRYNKNGWKSARQRIDSYSLNFTSLGHF